MDQQIIAQIEAILFVSSRPVRRRELIKVLGIGEDELEGGLSMLEEKYTDDSGVNIVKVDDKISLVSSPRCADVCQNFIKIEASGDLTRPQLESLTVIAYRGPITRAELEKIRGVNCAVILRNLMVRGLVEEKSLPDLILPGYVLSANALCQLGILDVKELPDYDKLSKHDSIESVLKDNIL